MSYSRLANRLFPCAANAFALTTFFLNPAACLEAQQTPGDVEFVCKILPAAADPGYKAWRVELRRTNGELVHQELRGTGEKAYFKNLHPGIYTVCVAGDRNRVRCESVDLTPPAGKRSAKFMKGVAAPERIRNIAENNRVSTQSLAIPINARREFLKSETAQRRGDSKESLKHLERALEIYPDYPEALNNLGVRHHRAHNYNEAIRCFRQAAKIEPDFYPARINLGGSLLATGQFAAALEATEYAHKLRSNEALANSQLALSHYYLRNYVEAEKYFKHVLVLDPLNAVSPQLFLAHISLARKRGAEAEAYLRQFLELHPNSPQTSRLRRTLDNLAASGVASLSGLDLISGP